jgi:hypothetical protein
VHLGQLGKSAEARIPLGNEYVKEQTAKKRGETYCPIKLGPDLLDQHNY